MWCTLPKLSEGGTRESISIRCLRNGMLFFLPPAIKKDAINETCQAPKQCNDLIAFLKNRERNLHGKCQNGVNAITITRFYNDLCFSTTFKLNHAEDDNISVSMVLFDHLITNSIELLLQNCPQEIHQNLQLQVWSALVIFTQEAFLMAWNHW